MTEQEAWPTKEDYLAVVEQNGAIVNAWKDLREHIGNDIIQGSRFDRLIWLMQWACDGAQVGSDHLDAERFIKWWGSRNCLGENGIDITKVYELDEFRRVIDRLRKVD